MSMISPTAQLPLTKGNKSWSSAAVAAAPGNSGSPWLGSLAVTYCGCFFFFFFFLKTGHLLDGSPSSVPPEDCDVEVPVEFQLLEFESCSLSSTMGPSAWGSTSKSALASAQ
eukprot:FR739334.1.p2 GENE.FR739334.1~~FR739334.1.p2  ORF type:complete len:112 (-),score=17.85 FR739334.1:281-616(-)